MLVDWAARQAEPKVHEVQTLGWEEDATVKQLLNEVARQVQPIMRKRQWVVPLLTEFYPAQANLLGLNVGGGGGHTQEIRIRVRRAGDRSSLLPYESLLGTMLHELVHNVRGPHDSVFYKLLDELQDECDELISKGISGSGVGFDGPSQGRLGAHSFIPQHNPPEHQLRNAVAQAAEARAKRARLMPTGPKKLGSGSGAWRNMSPAEAAAAAAERRARDDVWCPCGDAQRHGAAVGDGGQQGGGSDGGATSRPAAGGSGSGNGSGRLAAGAGAAGVGSTRVPQSGSTQQQDVQRQLGVASTAATPAAAAARAAEQRSGGAPAVQPGGRAGARQLPVVISLDDDGTPRVIQPRGISRPAGSIAPPSLIDLTDLVDSDDDGGAERSGRGAGQVEMQAGTDGQGIDTAHKDSASGSRAEGPVTWACTVCTYINHVQPGQTMVVCDMCQTPGPTTGRLRALV